MKVVNFRKNVVKAYFQEIARLTTLKAYKPYDEGDWKSNEDDISKSESRLKLLKELQAPLRDYYDL